MPRNISGIAPTNPANERRLMIEPMEESRLLAQAKAVGISDSDVGTFYVVLAAEVPAEITPAGYQLFSEEELRNEAEKHPAWFYDEDKRRLVGTIPSVKDITNRMRAV